MVSGCMYGAYNVNCFEGPVLPSGFNVVVI